MGFNSGFKGLNKPRQINQEQN